VEEVVVVGADAPADLEAAVVGPVGLEEAEAVADVAEAAVVVVEEAGVVAVGEVLVLGLVAPEEVPGLVALGPVALGVQQVQHGQELVLLEVAQVVVQALGVAAVAALVVQVVTGQ